ncbi:MAG: ABC transporter ATP-binding protein [Deltaproteobacteria bacterium]|nr:ABC transporter ATP-binding protein [Nannocystaceae bacterium]
MAQPDTLIRLRDVGKVYLTEEIETHALAGVQLGITAGEFVAIAGPSGSGKTTLLSLLGLLDVPSSGSYELGGRAVHQLDAGARADVRNREIGFIFQSFNLIPEMSVFENVELPLVYRGVAPAERRKRVHEVLERVDIVNRMNHAPAQLSGGQQQRVAVARAVVGKPIVLLADEPTGNLDSANAEGVMELLRELNRGGSTICMVTHDPRLTRWAGRVIRLFDGRVVDDVEAERWAG